MVVNIVGSIVDHVPNILQVLRGHCAVMKLHFHIHCSHADMCSNSVAIDLRCCGQWWVVVVAVA